MRLIENPEHTEWQPERAKNPYQERELLREINSFIKKQIDELISHSMDEAIDAVGVGNFIPDISDKSQNQAREEVISEKILDVEIKKIAKKNRNNNTLGQNEADTNENYEGHMEKGGNDEDWFHNSGHTDVKAHKPGEDAHHEDGGRGLKSVI